MDTGDLSPGVNRFGREGNHSLPLRADFNHAPRHTSTSPYIIMTWCFMNRDNFAFTPAVFPVVRETIFPKVVMSDVLSRCAFMTAAALHEGNYTEL
jgi:hypothetical protein